MILAGVMDAADTIDDSERSAAVEYGLTSGSGIVRLAALPALAALEGLDVAKQRAATDSSEKVRAWATKPPAQTPLALTEPPASHAQHQSADDGDQTTLF